MDLSDTIVPKSDQLNAEDLLTGPRTFTVKDVRKGSADQPVDIHLVEFPGRPFKPSKTVRRILVAAWGPDTSVYTGRRMTLYRDPAVRWAGESVGGIRVSHLSDISKPMTLALTVTRGTRATHTVKPLTGAAPGSSVASAQLLADLTSTFARKGIAEDVRLAGANRITGGSATALEVLTENEARKVLSALESRPDVEPALPVEDPDDYDPTLDPDWGQK